MTKIITYTDKKGGFTRRADGEEDTAEKKKSKTFFLRRSVFMPNKSWMNY